MQKVVGSNPISRFAESPLLERAFVFLGQLQDWVRSLHRRLDAQSLPNQPGPLS
jgi:hypothetical protein